MLSYIGMTTFVRVRILRRHRCFLAEPVSTTGASLLSTLAYSDGIVVAKYNNRGLKEMICCTRAGCRSDFAKRCV